MAKRRLLSEVGAVRIVGRVFDASGKNIMGYLLLMEDTYRLQPLDENSTIALFQRSKFTNAELSNGVVKLTECAMGNLMCFRYYNNTLNCAENNKIYVINKEVDEKGKTLGYTVLHPSGKIGEVSEKVLLENLQKGVVTLVNGHLRNGDTISANKQEFIKVCVESDNKPKRKGSLRSSNKLVTKSGDLTVSDGNKNVYRNRVEIWLRSVVNVFLYRCPTVSDKPNYFFINKFTVNENWGRVFNRKSILPRGRETFRNNKKIFYKVLCKEVLIRCCKSESDKDKLKLYYKKLCSQPEGDMTEECSILTVMWALYYNMDSGKRLYHIYRPHSFKDYLEESNIDKACILDCISGIESHYKIHTCSSSMFNMLKDNISMRYLNNDNYSYLSDVDFCSEDLAMKLGYCFGEQPLLSKMTVGLKNCSGVVGKSKKYVTCIRYAIPDYDEVLGSVDNCGELIMLYYIEKLRAYYHYLADNTPVPKDKFSYISGNIGNLGYKFTSSSIPKYTEAILAILAMVRPDIAEYYMDNFWSDDELFNGMLPAFNYTLQVDYNFTEAELVYIKSAFKGELITKIVDFTRSQELSELFHVNTNNCDGVPLQLLAEKVDKITSSKCDLGFLKSEIGCLTV